MNSRSESDVLAELKESLDEIKVALDRQFRLDATSVWMHQYTQLNSVADKVSLDYIKARPYEFISAAHYKKLEEEGEIPDSRLKEILITSRIYEYLLFAFNFKRTFTGSDVFPDAEFGARRWIRELSMNQDFRMVHTCQGGYYPNFSAEVNVIFRREAVRLQSRFPAHSMELERAARIVEEEIEIEKKARDGGVEDFDKTDEYKALQKLKETDPVEYQKIEDLARKKNLLPLDQENYTYLWLRYLDREDEDIERETKELSRRLVN